MNDAYPSLLPRWVQRPLGALGLLLATAGAAQAQTTTFAPVATYSTGAGSTPADIKVADVNGDGRLDLLTANFSTNTAGVLLGNGNGTFQAVATYSTGANSTPFGIAVADVNGDGRPDLLTANQGTNTAGVLLGNSSGTFQPVVAYSTGSGSTPFGIAVADVNADSRPDLLTANIDGAGVLLGNGNGTFQTVVTYVASTTGNTSNTYDIAVADLNGDGRPDLVTANVDISTAGVLQGNGNGTFQTVRPFSTGSNSTPYGIAVADVNGDGKPDLLTANYSSNTAGVLLNTTVFAAPTLTSLNPISGMAGATITLTGTNLTGASAVSFNGTAAAFTVVNATTITATVPAGATTGNVTVTTPGGLSNGLLFTVTYPDLVVSTTRSIPAGTYNSITVTSNGTLAGNVTVISSTTVNGGGTLHDGCAIIGGAGSFTLAAGATLGICNAAGITGSGAVGAVQNTGARSFSTDASYVYNGTAAQNTGNGLPGRVRNLSTTNATTVTLTAPTSATQVVTVGAAGNLALGGNALTLLSSSTGTALVVNSSTGIVSGNTATVQRYIDPSLNPGPGYRHYSAPVSNTTVGDLATAGFQPEISQAAAYNNSPTPNLVTPFPTVFGYDQALVNRVNTSPNFDKGFFVPSSLNTPLTPGRGYAVNISATELVDFVGTLNNDAIATVVTRNAPGTRNAADAGWQFLGNPYPAPLNYAQVDPADRAGLEAAMYVYSSTSQYTGQYRTYVNGIGNPILPVGQGFFVRVAQPGTSTFTFRNKQRLTAPDNTAFQRTAADVRPLVQLELRGSTGPADAFYAYAEAGATPALDSQYDAAKLPNPTGLNLASLAGPDRLAIDGRAAFTAATAIPLAVGVPAAGTYSLNATALGNLPAGLTAYLYDGQTGQATPLAVGTPYTFSVAANQVVANIVGRFTLQFNTLTPLAATASLSAAELTIYPNPAHERFTVLVPAVAAATSVQAELLNTLGQVVRRQAAALTATGATLTVETAGLATGVYTLRLQAGGSTLAKRVVVQ